MKCSYNTVVFDTFEAAQCAAAALSEKAIYTLRPGEYNLPDYKVVMVDGGYAIHAKFYFFSTHRTEADGLMSWDSFEVKWLEQNTNLAPKEPTNV